MSEIISNDQLSTNLKVARVGAGLSQETVAEMLGISRQTFNNYENNPYALSFSLFVKLASIYRIDVRSFFLA